METELIQLAGYKEYGVIIAVLIVLVYVFITFMKFIKETSDKHDKQQDEFMRTINANTKVTDETYQYLKLQNGSFKELMSDVRLTMMDCPENKKRRGK
jgi:hypothetical protein